MAFKQQKEKCFTPYQIIALFYGASKLNRAALNLMQNNRFGGLSFVVFHFILLKIKLHFLLLRITRTLAEATSPLPSTIDPPSTRLCNIAPLLRPMPPYSLSQAPYLPLKSPHTHVSHKDLPNPHLPSSVPLPAIATSTS